jgi:hypothetical protein
MKFNPLVVALALLIATPLIAQEDRQPLPPSTQPTDGQGVVKADDEAGLKAAIGKEINIDGIVEKAEWSRSGKVMNIEFKDSVLLGAVFERDSKALNEAFNGDFAKAITGAKVRIKSKLENYGGKDKKLEGRPQVIIKKVYQVTVLEPATSQPS